MKWICSILFVLFGFGCLTAQEAEYVDISEPSGELVRLFSSLVDVEKSKDWEYGVSPPLRSNEELLQIAQNKLMQSLENYRKPYIDLSNYQREQNDLRYFHITKLWLQCRPNGRE